MSGIAKAPFAVLTRTPMSENDDVQLREAYYLQF